MSQAPSAMAKGLRQFLAVLGVVAGVVPAPGYIRVRCATLVFGIAVGLYGTWWLIPVLLCPGLASLQQDRNLAEASAAHSTRAIIAADIAAVRGDLWAEAARASARFLWRDSSAGPGGTSSRQFDKIKAYAEKSLAFAPVNGAAWLLLAMLAQNSPDSSSRVSTLLELSYFTAPIDVNLAPFRVRRAATSSILANKDIQPFIKADIRGILDRRPDAQNDLLAAYRNAWPENQAVFEALVSEVDPSVADLLRSQRPE